MVYQPSEDSYLLEREVKDYIDRLENKDIKVLDMGSGSGIQAKACINKGIKNVLAVDIDEEAIKKLKQQDINAKKSDLFSNIPDYDYDLIIFNPPYLPEDEYDDKPDTTAGKKGYELILRFLKQAKQHLDKKGAILLLASTLSRLSRIKEYAEEQGYRCRKLSDENMGFFEKIEIWELKF
jgi:release factor glutamine methyltransferase